jgi:hypothetical protein
VIASRALPHQIRLLIAEGRLLAVSCNCLKRGELIHSAYELPAWLAREHYRHWHAMRGQYVR